MPSDEARDHARLLARVISLESVLRLAHRALKGRGLYDAKKALAAIEAAMPEMKEKETR